jgi:hypothetical protein
MVFSLAVRLFCSSAEVAGGVGRAEVAAAVVAMVEMPRLAGFDQLVAAAAADLVAGHQWLQLSAASDVRVGVAAGRAGSTGASSLPRSCRELRASGREARPILLRVHQRIGVAWAQVAERVCGDKRFKSTVQGWL